MKPTAMNRFLLLITVLLVARAGHAQQLPQYSQYMHNQYVVNPAAAGMNDYLDINLSFRQQWSGITDAPRTYYLSATSPLGKQEKPASRSLSIPISKPDMLIESAGPQKRKLKHALGGLVLADQYGAFNRTFVNLGYALHIPIGKKYYGSVGASLGWSGLNFDNSSITLEESVDATYFDFIANGNRANMFDLNLGAMFYSDNLYIGYGLYQIMQSRIKLGGGDSPAGLTEARLKDHHYILAGYRIGLGEKWAITPSAMLKNQGPAPLSFDVNMRLDYMRKYWLGVSYRHEDAVVAMLGVTIKDLIRVGYSYDYTLSQLNNLSNGSHEIVLGLMLFKK
jgi:type IX secretion system PorP/SprF family membrane protein